MSRAQANSQAAADYAKKKKEQLERANRLKMERNSQQISRPNSHSDSRPGSNQDLLVMYESLEHSNDSRARGSNEKVKISRQDYQFIDQKTLEQQAKAKHDRDLELFHQAKASSSSRGVDAANPRVTASSIISDPYSLSHIRTINAPHADGQSFFNPPQDASGRLVDLSDRPLLCLSSNLRNEIVIGSADHALYAIDVSNSPTRPPIKMYSKTAGHTDWITGVAHLPDGRVISSSMDGKLCLWETNRRNCVDLFGHQGSITKVTSPTRPLPLQRPHLISSSLLSTYLDLPPPPPIGGHRLYK
jgi:WD40 repeat protein